MIVNDCMKKFWLIMYVVFFRNIPDYFKFGVSLRGFAVRRFIKKSGRNISIGYGSRINRNTELGENSGVGRNCEIMNGVSIGNNVMMGPDVYMCTETHEFKDTSVPMRTQGFKEIKKIVIEDDVWIGARVIILPGVTIGKGSVVGAGAVVPRSIPPYSVAVGNPARVVKSRLKEDV